MKHLIRQEKNGGYWLIRDEGRTIELNPVSYQLLARLHESKGLISQDEHKKFEKELLFNGGTGVIKQLEKYQLTTPENWQTVRLVKSDVPLQELPDDTVIAPKRIYFEITRYCNLACRSCFNNSHHKLPHELSIEEILDVNRQAEELGVFEIRYTGGECTRVQGFEDIVKDARKRGIYISIGTNGVYTEEQLEWLPTCGIDWFIISLDGNKEANDKVRGKGTFDSVLATLKRLADFPHLRIRLNMVVAKHNINQIEEVAAIASHNNVTSLNLIPLRPYGRSTKRMTQDMFAQKDFYQFIFEINRLRKLFPSVVFSTTIDLLDPDAVTSHDLIVQKKKTCAAGVEACVIGPQGHVYGCSYSPASFPNSADEQGKKVFIAGNIRQDSLKTIWRDSSRWEVFRNLKLYKNEKCHSCDHYTVRCSGSCQIMSYYQLKHEQEAAAGKKELNEFLDPYCFVDIFDQQAKGKAADLSAPCGGAGMDGF